MAEGMNIEVAHKAHEQSKDVEHTSSNWLEIVEAIVLAVVAVATAWSGYQAAKWEGEEAMLYAHATELRVEASREQSEAAEQRLIDVSTLNAWLQAKAEGQDEAARLIAQRFSEEYTLGFEEWLATGGFDHPEGEGPADMPSYHSHLAEDADHLDKDADEVFAEASHSRHVADEYVRVTVILATVLFLVIMAQRFKSRNIRIALMVVAGVLMTASAISIASFPRL